MRTFSKSIPSKIYPETPPSASFGDSQIILLKDYGPFSEGDILEMSNISRYVHPSLGKYCYGITDGEESHDIEDVSKFRAGIEFNWYKK